MVKAQISKEELAERLWKRVRKNPEGCWEWLGAKTTKGYGNFGGQSSLGKWAVYTHRLSYEIAEGRIPEGVCVLHRCDNPPCVRPDHLFLGTKGENNKDCWLKGRHSRGEGRWKAKLKEKEIPAIRALLALGFTEETIGRLFNVTPQCIHHIRVGKNWKHVK